MMKLVGIFILAIAVGCPMVQSVQDDGTATAMGEGLHEGLEDRPAAFFVDAQGKHGDLSVVVGGPNSLARCNIEPDHTGRYIVTYTPVEVGTFNIKIKWNGQEIQGSPFQARVVNPRKVRPVGDWATYGIDHNNKMMLNINEQKIIKLDASDAGPGQISAELRGPMGMVPVNTYSSGHVWTIEFLPQQEGEYQLHVKFNEANLPRSPFRGRVSVEAPPPPVPASPAL